MRITKHKQRSSAKRESSASTTHATTTQKNRGSFSITATFGVAWKRFARYAEKAYQYTGEPFVNALSKAFRVLRKMLTKLLKFVFYPIVVITRGIRFITKNIAKAFFAHWKRILAVLFVVLALVVSIDEHKLAQWAGASTPTSVNAQVLVENKAQLVSALLSKHLVTPLLSFLAVGLPQLTYELLRVWHFVLADGMTSLLDTMVAGLKLAKAILPASARSLIDWHKLESTQFSKRLHDARTADIQNGDPLLKSYLNAHQAMMRRQKQSVDAFRQAGWKKESREGLDTLWKDIRQDSKDATKASYQKYITGDVRADEGNVQTLTLSGAFQQLKSTPTHMANDAPEEPPSKNVFVGWSRKKRQKEGNLRGTHTRKRARPLVLADKMVNAVPEPMRRKTVEAYKRGARKVSKAIFDKNDPSEITVQNLSHLYFGLVAVGGTSSGITDGIRTAFFKHARTGAMVKLGGKMKGIEEIVPVCFYLDE